MLSEIVVNITEDMEFQFKNLTFENNRKLIVKTSFKMK